MTARSELLIVEGGDARESWRPDVVVVDRRPRLPEGSNGWDGQEAVGDQVQHLAAWPHPTQVGARFKTRTKGHVATALLVAVGSWPRDATRKPCNTLRARTATIHPPA